MNSTDFHNDAQRDPAELERDSAEIRADMDRTLDALEKKFSPGQVLDRSMNVMRERGPELAGYLIDSVKRNPMPILLTAAGLAWLAMSENRPRNTATQRSQALGSSAAQSVGLKSRIRTRAHAAGEQLHAATDRLRSSKDAVLNRVTGALENPREQTQLAKQRVERILEDQPLVLGAIGVAVGAIIGAAVPETQYENRVLGRAREQAIAKAREMGERQYENVRGAIGAGSTQQQQPAPN